MTPANPSLLKRRAVLASNVDTFAFRMLGSVTKMKIKPWITFLGEGAISGGVGRDRGHCRGDIRCLYHPHEPGQDGLIDRASRLLPPC